MKAKVATTMVVMLLIGCLSSSAYATDHTITDPKWAEMSKKDKDKFIRHLIKKKLFREGRDRITYNPSPNKPTSPIVNCWLCSFLAADPQKTCYPPCVAE